MDCKIIERIKMVTGDDNPFFINSFVVFNAVDSFYNHLSGFYQIIDETSCSDVHKAG